VRVLVTGSDGYLGRMVCRLLTMRGHTPIGFDLPQDVLTHTIPEADACIHLAANKYATHAEENPAETAHLNIAGTQRIVQHIPRTVLASTCKAAAPITSYGASKLIAERITLNAGGSVVRLVNVLGSTGSVTDIWDATPKGQPLPVTNCKRTATHHGPDPRPGTLWPQAGEAPHPQGTRQPAAPGQGHGDGAAQVRRQTGGATDERVGNNGACHPPHRPDTRLLGTEHDEGGGMTMGGLEHVAAASERYRLAKEAVARAEGEKDDGRRRPRERRRGVQGCARRFGLRPGSCDRERLPL
jgi:hypothetical protein